MVDVFSLKLQRDNRQKALAVDHAKGKTGEKGRIFTSLWRWTNYNRAFLKGSVMAKGCHFVLLCHGMLLFHPTVWWKYGLFLQVLLWRALWLRLFLGYSFGTSRRHQPFLWYSLLFGLYYSMWLFHLHSAIKNRAFFLVFPLAGSTVKTFSGYAFGVPREKASPIFYNTAFVLYRL